MPTALDVFLLQFDVAWGHPFESITSALDGVSDAEAAWQAPCYRNEKREEGWPPPGTIRWQVCHLAHCKGHYTDILLRAGESEPPDVVPWTLRSSFADERAALEEVHARQREALVGLGDDRLDVIAGNQMPFREFVSMFIRHDSWHAGQIAVARRLYQVAVEG